ncbi:MAG: FAD-dependent oxidoreductase [Planctomycetota bacterium]
MGPDRGQSLTPQSSGRRVAGIYLHWGCRVDCRDTRDPVALAEAQRDGLEAMAPKLDELRSHGWAAHLAPKLGVRETRRVMGRAVITAGDLVRGNVPDDSVLVTRRPIDIWSAGRSQMDYPEVKPYGIPYRALVARDVDALLVVGKSMSGTHLAMASYRVQCLLGQIGQAAGVAAAMCAQHDTQPAALDAGALLKRLTAPPQNMVISADPRWVAGPAS